VASPPCLCGKLADVAGCHVRASLLRLRKMPIIKEDPFRSYNPDTVKFGRMKDEVADAMRFDWKRDKVDSAKKKAIYDCKNYDDFKQRVAGCTLKPIRKNEFNEPPKFVFNRAAGGTGAGVVGTHVVSPLSNNRSSGADGAVAPRSSSELERELRRRATAEEKVRLIETIDDSDSCARLFGIELDAEMFRKLLAALDEVDEGVSPGTARRFLSALVSGCQTSAASAAAFLTAVERGMVTRLLARDPVADPEQDTVVCDVFGAAPPSSQRPETMAGEVIGAEALRSGTLASTLEPYGCDEMD